MQPLSTYIQHPELIDADTVKDLQLLVEQYPSFQTARLLLLRGLYQLQDERFGLELRKAAIAMPDRRRLYELFEGDTYLAKGADLVQPTYQQSANQPTADRTLSLIDSFLQQRPEPSKSHRARPADATVDYTAYLLQLDDAVPSDDEELENEPMATAADIVPLEVAEGTKATLFAAENIAPAAQEEKTLQSEQPSSALETTSSDTEDDVDEEQQSEPSEAYFTETLARIYIKQGKYAKAIEIIRRISLLYPQKNRYFADQIRFLEKLLINERNKKSE